MQRDDTEALLCLAAAGGPADVRRALLERFGSSSAALAAGVPAWRASGVLDAQIEALLAPDALRLRAARDWLAAPDHHLLACTDPDYPPLLRRSPNPPLALFVAGDPTLLWRAGVAIVGSRAATPGGRDNAALFAHSLAAAGFCIVSGLASGIDAAAHEAALEAGGATVAVLGTGADVPYPQSHAALHARIARVGAIVSEHFPGTRARPEHFPSRNRILAGLALGTLVIEAAHRSGALITARLAAEAGREVFALPGSIHNPYARGCHRLIRDGAALVETPAEVTSALAATAAELASDLRLRLQDPISGPSQPAATGRGRASTQSATGLDRQDGNYQTLWKALGHDPTDMDQLVARTGLTPAELSSMLLIMELDGRVTTQHGRYHRSRRSAS